MRRLANIFQAGVTVVSRLCYSLIAWYVQLPTYLHLATSQMVCIVQKGEY